MAIKLYVMIATVLVSWGIGVCGACNDISSSGKAIADEQTSNSPLKLELLRAWNGHDKPVMAVAFSPDNRLLASGGQENTDRLWDVFNGESLASFNHRKVEGYASRCLAFSPDGAILASGGQDGEVVFWDVVNKKVSGRLVGNVGVVTSIAFTPDGKTLVSASGTVKDGEIKFWNVAKGTCSATIQESSLSARVATSPDGKFLASAGMRNIKIWDMKSRTRRLTVDEPEVPYHVAFSPDGRMIASSNGKGNINLWELRSGKKRLTLTGHISEVRHVYFAPDGQTLVSGGSDGTIRLWDLRGNAPAEVYAVDARLLYCLAISPDGNLLASGHGYGDLKLWRISRTEKKTAGQP